MITPPQVGAVSLCANLDCDAFANSHTGTAHFDRESFVGLAWRPPDESICCEIYSTGRANLPGSTRERELYGSFVRMLPQLIMHSDRPAQLLDVPEELRECHRPVAGVLEVSKASVLAGKKKEKAVPKKKAITDMYDDEVFEPLEATGVSYEIEEGDDELLDAVGF